MNEKTKRPHIWPGMPTNRSQFFESFVYLLIPALAISIAIVLGLITSIRGCVGGP